jgi:glycosyltransferase involved in cell wall biosynthesis
MSGEPLEQFGERPHRIGILSKMLVQANHQVTWWTTAYDHQHKKYLFNQDTEIQNEWGVNMIFLHPKTGYNKNISVKRIINHVQVGGKFTKISQNKEKPDVILCAYPTLDLAHQAVKYGQNNQVPVVIDVRDMWPDIFEEVLPNALTKISKLAFYPLQQKAKKIFKNTFAISGVTDEFVKFGVKKSGRKQKEFDQAFAFGYPQKNIGNEKKIQIKDALKKRGIHFNQFIVCFFGTIGAQFDFEPVIEAAKKLTALDLQFVLCGKGDNLENLEERTKNIDNIIFPGWLTEEEIILLMENAKIGLSCYVEKNNFLHNLTNKNIEYLAGKLPILTSIGGVSGSLFNQNNCGFVYDNSSEKLTEYVSRLYNNFDLQQEMSKNAYSLFKKQFSAEKVYGEMIQYLEKIAKNYKG